MKRSEFYHLAQIAVVCSQCVAPENKLEILRILMEDEHHAKWCEKEEEKKKAVAAE